MRRSRFSSFVLVLLLALSFALSYLLYKDTISTESVFNNNDPVTDSGPSSLVDNYEYDTYFSPTKETISDMTSPVRYIISQGEETYQIINDLTVDQITDYLQEYPFDGYSVSDISNASLSELLPGDFIEIDFATSLPVDISGDLIKEASENIEHFKFSRIYVPLDGGNIAYLYNHDSESYVSILFNDNLTSKDLMLFLESKSVDWQEVEVYKGKNSFIYLPKDKLSVDEEYFVLEIVPELQVIAETFVNDDYESVETDNTGINSYQTYQYNLDVNTIQNTITYTETQMDNKSDKALDQLIDESFTTLTKYECWPYELRLTRSLSNQLIYRRYYNGLPIYNTTTSASVDYGSSRVSFMETSKRYYVPLARPEIHLDDMSVAVEVESAYEIVNIIEANGYHLSAFNDVFLGYEWAPYNKEGNLCILAPSWYFVFEGKVYSLEEIQASEFKKRYFDNTEEDDLVAKRSEGGQI